MDTITSVIEVKYYIHLDYPNGGTSTSGGWDTLEEARAAFAANPEWFTFEGIEGHVVRRTTQVVEEKV